MPHSFWLSHDVVTYMLRFLCLVDLVYFARVHRAASEYTKRYLQGRVSRYTSPFLAHPLVGQPRQPSVLARFFLALEISKSWIVGSIALAAASVLSDPPCPDNLNIITSGDGFRTLLDYFTGEAGYRVVHRHWSTGAYARAGRMVSLSHPTIKVSPHMRHGLLMLNGLWITGPCNDHDSWVRSPQPWRTLLRIPQH